MSYSIWFDNLIPYVIAICPKTVWGVLWTSTRTLWGSLGRHASFSRGALSSVFSFENIFWIYLLLQVRFEGRLQDQEDRGQACSWCSCEISTGNTHQYPWECAGLWRGGADHLVYMWSWIQLLTCRCGLNVNIFHWSKNIKKLFRSILMSTCQPMLNRKSCQCLRPFDHYHLEGFNLATCCPGCALGSSGTPTDVCVCGASCTERGWKDGILATLWGSLPTCS